MRELPSPTCPFSPPNAQRLAAFLQPSATGDLERLPPAAPRMPAKAAAAIHPVEADSDLQVCWARNCPGGLHGAKPARHDDRLRQHSDGAQRRGQR